MRRDTSEFRGSEDRMTRSIVADIHMTRSLTPPAAPDHVWSHTPAFYERFMKPVLDVAAGLLLALLATPLMLLIIVVIWMMTGRPAILRQDRIGKDDQTFELFKFRTMDPDRRSQQLDFSEPDRRRIHKSPHDPRLTRVGRFLRKWSLDELPQLWNVVLGDMSLVGPRPELVQIVEHHYEPWQHRRHVVKPGVTGLWQVSSRGDNGMMHHNTHIDLAYVEQLSFLFDLKILIMTIPAVLGMRKGY